MTSAKQTRRPLGAARSSADWPADDLPRCLDSSRSHLLAPSMSSAAPAASASRAAAVAAATRVVPISAHDPNSFANNRHAKITHSHLVLSVDFNQSVISGHVDHTVAIVADTTELILDTAPTLDVQGVQVVDASGAVSNLSYEIGKLDEVFGVPLVITLPESARKAGATATVRVAYRTAPDAGAIQWLPPAQTKGGKLPYMFTQW